MTDFLIPLLLAVVPAVLAITLHEAAHGYAALALGDDTARNEGRLSLNPLRHIDRVGTILLPGLLLLSQLLTIGRVAFMFGWAKPVPVAAWKFADPRRGMALVAVAGPATNFLLAWVGALSLHAVSAASWQYAFVGHFILFNLVIGLFNLLPILPLDGGRIVAGALPEGAARRWATLERGGIVVVLLAVFVLPWMAQNAGYTFDPVGLALSDAVGWAWRLVMTLAGHGQDMPDAAVSV